MKTELWACAERGRRDQEIVMGMRTTFMVQTFEIHRKRLRPGARDVAPTENGALKRAEAIRPADAGDGGAAHRGG